MGENDIIEIKNDIFFGELKFTIPKNTKLLILVGPNGSGKTRFSEKVYSRRNYDMDRKLGEERLEKCKEEAGGERKLWKRLKEATKKHQIEWVWTPKEVASAGYEREDAVELAKNAMQEHSR